MKATLRQLFTKIASTKKIALSFSLLLTSLFSTAATAQTDKSAVIEQIGETQWQSISQAINHDQISRSHFIQPPTADKNYYSTLNQSHGWQAQFSPSGKTQLLLQDKHIDMRLSHWGHQGHMEQAAAQPTAITVEKNQLDYQWSDNITERWTNTPAGTEQWFIVQQRPSTNAHNNQLNNQLSVTLDLDSSLAISQQGQSLLFSDDDIKINYDKLKVWDSKGQFLTASMTLHNTQLTLLVDDSNASYPITIDPVFTAQQAYIKASNTGQFDQFGSSVALSADGNTLAVGAFGEASNATGIPAGNTGQADNSAGGAGAVYVFTRTGTGSSATWTQQAYVKASNTGASDFFGGSLALSADGNTLAVSANGEASNATGVPAGNTGQADNTVSRAGAVYVFTRTGTGSSATWTQQNYIKASNTGANDNFGYSVALSADGNTLAVGAYREASNATGINGNQADNTAEGAGAVYVFTRTGTGSSATWTQQNYIKASNTGANDNFGYSVALSADGNTLAVGAYREASNATGINAGNTGQADNSASSAGAVYVFTRTGTGSSATWTQQAYVKASNTGLGDVFGESVALSADGNTLAVGAPGEASNATGINGNQADNSAVVAGAVYVFTRTGSSATWTQQAYIKASNTGALDVFGTSVALSADGNTLAVGAIGEVSNATGINGNQADNSAGSEGAGYVFTRTGSTWVQQAYVKASNTGANDQFGSSVVLSDSGNTLAVGATEERSNATGIPGGNTGQADNSADAAGAVYVFRASAADLSITKTLDTPAPYSNGQTVSYTVTVNNAGPDAATNVLISNVLNNLNITLVSGAGCTALPCTIASLANGGSATLNITATITGSGAFGITGTVSSATTDSRVSNNTATSRNSTPARPSISAWGLVVAIVGLLIVAMRYRRRLLGS